MLFSHSSRYSRTRWVRSLCGRDGELRLWRRRHSSFKHERLRRERRGCCGQDWRHYPCHIWAISNDDVGDFFIRHHQRWDIGHVRVDSLCKRHYV